MMRACTDSAVCTVACVLALSFAFTDSAVCTVACVLALSFAFKLNITSYCLEIVPA